MTLEQLRKEFTHGNMLCEAHHDREVGIHLYFSQKFLGTVYVKLCNDGSLRVIKIRVNSGMGRAQQLILIAKREKIFLEVFSPRKPGEDTYPAGMWGGTW